MCLFVHCKHNLSQGTWTKDHRLLRLRPNLPLPWHLLSFPAPPLPPPVMPAAPAPPAFALGPRRSHAVLDYDNPNTGATATKLYNKAISPLKEKFDREADSLAMFLASMHNRAHHFNWHHLITVPIDDGTTRNILTHYGQVSLENTRTHAMTYVNSPT